MEENFKNHSMRKSTRTRLFRKGVDPQLIKEQTGHKSEAVMLYKKSNLKQNKEVSDMLSVLPRKISVNQNTNGNHANFGFYHNSLNSLNECSQFSESSREN